MSKMHITQLPNELLQLIASTLSSLDAVQRLSQANRHFYHLVKSKEFGREWMRANAHHVSAGVKIYTPISWNDTITFATLRDGRRCVIHNHDTWSGKESTVYLIRLRPSGKLKLKTVTIRDQLFECWLPLRQIGSNSCTHQFQQHLPFCHTCNLLEVTKVDYFIDKNYPVFFQSWSDIWFYELEYGMKLAVEVIHDWQKRTELDVMYNGQPWSMKNAVNIELFFGGRKRQTSRNGECDDASTNHSPARERCKAASDRAMSSLKER